MNAYTATQIEMSEEDEEGTIQGGGLGFSLGRRKFDEDGDTSRTTQKKKMKFANGSAVPMASTSNSFAARMMAKMGYVEGQGLGADGRGRLAPIETKLRPQGVGLGAVKEKTKQAKEEEKREAAFRGQVIEDSSGEEKERRRKWKENRLTGGGSGTSTPGRGRPKTKYKTAAEIEAESEGLEVPNVLKTIIDITGKETKLLGSADGLLSSGIALVPSETASTRIAKQARRDLEAFADEWKGLSDRKNYYDLTHSQIIGELDSGQEELQRMKSLVEGVQALQLLAAEALDARDHSAQWERVTKKLESLEIDFRDERDSYGLHELTVAAIHPMFRKAMLNWAPLEDPGSVSSYIQRLSHLLNIQNGSSATTAMTIKNGSSRGRTKRAKVTTEYESMIYTLWLRPVRTAVTNHWDPYNPTPLITLLTIWKPLLPDWVFANLIDQQVVPRITTALNDWKPFPKKKRHEIPAPHIWIFPWLPHLPSYHTDTSAHPDVYSSPWATDANSGFGVLSQVKNKLKSLLQKHDVASGPPSYLTPWQQLLPVAYPNLLTRHLLPRLATYLHANFTIDPSNQDLAPLKTALEYASLFSPSTLAALFVAELFPQWHEILHIWLTSSPAYDEIQEWYLWWKEQLPSDITTHPLINAEWNKGLSTINLALELGPDAATQLPRPAAGPARPLVSETNGLTAKAVTGNISTSSKIAAIEETTFKDIVEAWCAEQSLLMMPLREAHETTGNPIFRITASASGKGGVKVYLKGDVVWAKDKTGGWRPVELGEGLVGMAEG